MAQVDNRDFVVAWMTAKTIQDVAKALNINQAAARNKARYLRSKGVSLPKLHYPLKDNSLEVAQLNSLVKKYQKERG